jgi:MoaA/NifB/PqqE/SkfB family radical SAM enzyme
LEEIASFCQPIVIFSGGEALLRDDIFEIVGFAKGLGLTPVIATCGVTLTKEKAKQLKRAGIKRVSVSIDGENAATHDSIRNEKGAFVKALTAMRMLK